MPDFSVLGLLEYVPGVQLTETLKRFMRFVFRLRMTVLGPVELLYRGLLIDAGLFDGVESNVCIGFEAAGLLGSRSLEDLFLHINRVSNDEFPVSRGHFLLGREHRFVLVAVERGWLPIRLVFAGQQGRIH